METAKYFTFMDDEGETVGLILQGAASRVIAGLFSGTAYCGCIEDCLRLAKLAMGDSFEGKLVNTKKAYDVEKVNGVWKEISKEEN